MKKEVLLYTSGLDSYIAREYLNNTGHDFDCLYFNHGGRYCGHELEMILKSDVKVIIDDRLNLKDLEADDAHIPNRNILFTTLALSLGYEKVWLGGTLSDRVGDNKSEVCERLSELLSTVNESYCKIDSPFYNCYKDDIVKWFVSIHPACRLDLVKETFSCFNPLSEMAVRPVWVQGLQGEYETYECGKCTACFRKNAVLHSGDIFVGFDDVNIVNHYEEQFGKPIVATPRTIGTMAYIMEWWEKKDAAREETGL